MEEKSVSFAFPPDLTFYRESTSARQIGLFRLSRNSLMILLRDIFDREQDERMTGLQFNAAGVEQHITGSDARKIVSHGEIVHAGIARNNFLQQFPQLWNIPLPVSQFVDWTVFGLFLRRIKSAVECRIRSGNLQPGIQYYDRFPSTLDNRVCVFPRLIQLTFENVNVLQADHCTFDAIVPGLVGAHV